MARRHHVRPEERALLAALRGVPPRPVVADVDHARLMGLLERLSLVQFAGPAFAEAPPWFTGAVARVEEATRREATLRELVGLRVLAALDDAGISAAPVKGVALATAAHGDVAARSPGDIDLLLRPGDLSRAAEVVRALGWGAPEDVLDARGLPLLHLCLPGSAGVPEIELHWRMHWWEADFAPAALARAARADAGVRLTPGDHLAVVLMSYARDGLAGLRHPVDAAALVRRSGGLRLDPVLVAGPLGPALTAAAVALETVLGVPAAGVLGRSPATGWRLRANVALVDPFLRDADRQIPANQSLADLMLAPRGGWHLAARRQLAPPADELRRRRPDLRRRGPAGMALARIEHAVRLLARYGLVGGRVVRALARRPRAGGHR